MKRAALDLAGRFGGAFGIPVAAAAVLYAVLRLAPGVFFESGEHYLQERGMDSGAVILDAVAPGRNIYVYNGHSAPGRFLQAFHQAGYAAERVFRDGDKKDFGSRFTDAFNHYVDFLSDGRENVMAAALVPGAGQGNDCFVRPVQEDLRVREYLALFSGIPVSHLETGFALRFHAIPLMLFLHEGGHCPQDFIENPSDVETKGREDSAEVAGIQAYLDATGDETTVELIRYARAIGGLALRPMNELAYDDGFSRATAPALDAWKRDEPLPQGALVVQAYRTLEARALASPAFLRAPDFPYAFRVAAALDDMQKKGFPHMDDLEKKAAILYLDGMRHLVPRGLAQALSVQQRTAPAPGGLK